MHRVHKLFNCSNVKVSYCGLLSTAFAQFELGPIYIYIAQLLHNSSSSVYIYISQYICIYTVMPYLVKIGKTGVTLVNTDTANISTKYNIRSIRLYQIYSFSFFSSPSASRMHWLSSRSLFHSFIYIYIYTNSEPHPRNI